MGFFTVVIPVYHPIENQGDMPLPDIEFQIPGDYPVPPLGGDFLIRFEEFIKDPEDWERVLSMLENDVLTVEKIEDNKISLIEGIPTDLTSPDPDEYFPAYIQYWEKHPQFKPVGL